MIRFGNCFGNRFGIRSGVLAIVIGTVVGASPALAVDAACTDDYAPAPPGYDFTAEHDRWGLAATDYGIGENATVRNIYVNALPIFDITDPRENKALYRLANRLNVETDPVVFRRLILFKEGEPVSNDLVAESERILREPKFTSDASIRVVSRCGDEVDLEVITREVWTLVPDLKLKTSGGKTEFGFGVHDSNFLGTGSKLIVSYAQQVERDRILLEFSDDNFRGSRISLLAHFEENSDGYVRALGVSLPFYALDSTRSWGVFGRQAKWTESQYQSGTEVTAIGIKQNYLELWGGSSDGLVDSATRRYRWGVVVDRYGYQTVPETPPTPIPDAVNLAYPFIEYEYVENEFGVGYNINQIRRSEDIHMGRTVRARFGVSPTDEVRVIFSGVLADTLRRKNKKLLQASIDWQGRYNVVTGSTEDARTGLTIAYHRGQTDYRSLYLGLNYINTWNLTSEKQVLLGGSNGLRGYPTNFASGTTSLLFTAEQRVFTDWTLFRLFNIGLVAFADVGRAYYKGDDPFEDHGWLSDVGLGFRLVPDKTDVEHVIHFDVGYPLKKLPGATGVQIKIEVKKTL